MNFQQLVEIEKKTWGQPRALTSDEILQTLGALTATVALTCQNSPDTDPTASLVMSVFMTGLALGAAGFTPDSLECLGVEPEITTFDEQRRKAEQKQKAWV